jgi:hypothetical protein
MADTVPDHPAAGRVFVDRLRKQAEVCGWHPAPIRCRPFDPFDVLEVDSATVG